MKLLVIVLFVLILASLGAGLRHLVRDQQASGRVARALTWRIALSVALFVLLMAAWFAGLIRPNGVPGG